MLLRRPSFLLDPLLLARPVAVFSPLRGEGLPLPVKQLQLRLSQFSFYSRRLRPAETRRAPWKESGIEKAISVAWSCFPAPCIDRTNSHHRFEAESGRKPEESPARTGIYVNVTQRFDRPLSFDAEIELSAETMGCTPSSLECSDCPMLLGTSWVKSQTRLFDAPIYFNCHAGANSLRSCLWQTGARSQG